MVIAGGWSVSQYDMEDFRDRATVIGVNDSAMLLPCDLGITMDRLWFEGRYPEFKKRFTEASLLRMEPVPKILYYRTGNARNVQLIPTHRFRAFSCDHKSAEMSDELLRFNGTNSGICGINLALQLKPRRLYLLGFDMQRGPKNEPYWYPAYPWAGGGSTKPGKYESWVRDFNRIAEQCRDRHVEVFNVNHRSAITAFQTIGIAECKRLLGQEVHHTQSHQTQAAASGGPPTE